MNKIFINKLFFSFWYLSLITPIIFLSDYWVSNELKSSGIIETSKAIVLFIFFLYCFFFIKVTKDTTKARNTFQTKLFYGFIIYCLISTIWSLSPYKSFLNSIFLLFLSYSIIKIDTRYGIEEFLKLIPLISSIILIIAILSHGINGRFIGGNQPNLIGQICFCGVISSLFLKNKFKFIYIIFFLTIILFVNSRIYLISSFISLFLFHYLFLKRFKLLYLFSLISFLILSFIMFHNYFELLFQKVFLVNDLNRGIKSGFTGRTYFWVEGFELFKKNFILGTGFRTRMGIFDEKIFMSAHSGFINLAIDLGLVGFILILILIINSITKRLKNLNFILIKNKKSLIFEKINIALFPSILLITFIEPSYFYLGLPINFFFITNLIIIKFNYP